MIQPPEDAVLPTFAVLARFREPGPTADEAVRAVTVRLTEAHEPFHEVTVERQEPDGSWLVVARFVTVSIDAHTAVIGVSETLTMAGVHPDEVWMHSQLP